MWCLVKQYAEKFRKALKNGEIDPEKMALMSSAERRAFLEQFVGKENAVNVNSLFESKLLLKNQQAGMITWAKKVAGLNKTVQRDLISRIERMDKVLNVQEGDQFLQDLASTKLGADVTQEEAQKIYELSRTVTDTKSKWVSKIDTHPEWATDSWSTRKQWLTDSDRLAYGWAEVNLRDYVGQLKLSSQNKSLTKTISEVPGTLKSIVASLDNSFFGRQGIKTLYTNPTVWTRNFLKSWGDIGKELKGQDAIKAIQADIYSRPNAVNGRYEAGNYGLNVTSEEQFPSSLPEKIPGIKRLFKASESAYNGAALRIRADLADKYIKLAEDFGVDTLNKEQARPLGRMISSLTGRGSLGPLEPVSGTVNKLFFSIKYVFSNFQTLLDGIKYPAKAVTGFANKGEQFASRESAINLLKLIASIGSILATAKALDPESVDIDPRSTNFGKVKIYGQWTDITGGLASVVTLASRLIPLSHNGKFAFWYKSSSGNWIELSLGAYGQMTPLDVLESFIEGKLSPAAGILRDVWKGQTYDGQKATLLTELENVLTPLSIQNLQNLLNNPTTTSVLGPMIMDGLGFSVNTYQYNKDWNLATSKELTTFKDKVGQKKFKEANNEYNKQYNEWFATTSQNPEYKNLSEESKQALITQAKQTIQKRVLRQYDFIYERDKKPATVNMQEKQTVKSLTPNK